LPGKGISRIFESWPSGVESFRGGVLDRLDSIIFAAPALYYYVIYFF
jgi:hypothetical protein